MKNHITTALKTIANDRSFIASLTVLVLLSLGYCLFVAFTLQPADVQVVVRYSAYSEQTLYRDQWWYLFSFIGFGLLVGVGHSSIAIKLYQIGHIKVSYGFIAISLIILIVGFSLTKAVLGAAYF